MIVQITLLMPDMIVKITYGYQTIQKFTRSLNSKYSAFGNNVMRSPEFNTDPESGLKPVLVSAPITSPLMRW
jgi:hypothetical protein